jgi:hypothetical protein
MALLTPADVAHDFNKKVIRDIYEVGKVYLRISP